MTMSNMHWSRGVKNGNDRHRSPRLDRVVNSFELTNHQKSIMLLLALGYTSEQIAIELGITGNTLRTHLRNMFTQLRVSDRSKLVALVLDRLIEQLDR